MQRESTTVRFWRIPRKPHAKNHLPASACCLGFYKNLPCQVPIRWEGPNIKAPLFVTWCKGAHLHPHNTSFYWGGRNRDGQGALVTQRWAPKMGCAQGNRCWKREGGCSKLGKLNHSVPQTHAGPSLIQARTGCVCQSNGFWNQSDLSWTSAVPLNGSELLSRFSNFSPAQFLHRQVGNKMPSVVVGIKWKSVVKALCKTPALTSCSKNVATLSNARRDLVQS